MSEKRLYPRYRYTAKTHFRFFEGDPDIINTATASPVKGKGRILDISQSGLSIATNSLVSVNIPIVLSFRLNGKKLELTGSIVRTGKIDRNPSALARGLSLLNSGRKYFIAVKFNEPLNNLQENDLT
jgi:hypothetical protein